MTDDYDRARRRARHRPTWWLRRRAQRITSTARSTRPSQIELDELAAIRSTIVTRSRRRRWAR